MIESHTAIIERAAEIGGDFSTEPYEAAWATEAIFFVRDHDTAGPTHVAYIQISPDGLHWCDEGTELTLVPGGLAHAKVTNFGGWLRLRLDLTPDNRVLSIQLVLKG